MGLPRRQRLTAGACPLQTARSAKAQLPYPASQMLLLDFFVNTECWECSSVITCLNHYYYTLTAMQRLPFHRTYSSPSCDRLKLKQCLNPAYIFNATSMDLQGFGSYWRHEGTGDTILYRYYFSIVQSEHGKRKGLTNHSSHLSTTKRNCWNKACLKSSIC